MSLAKDSIRAEDLVQETLLKGWKYRHLYQPGTNLEAWLFTIQRNLFYSQRRKRAREAEDPNEEQAARLSVPPTQGDRLDLEDVRTAMAQLPKEQQEALTLVVFNEMSYEKAAELMNSKTGTIKSRVNRARNHLIRLLGYEHSDLRASNIHKDATPRSWGMLHNNYPSALIKVWMCNATSTRVQQFMLSRWLSTPMGETENRKPGNRREAKSK